MTEKGRGCVKTQFAPGGEQHRVATEVLRERRIQRRVTSHSEIAYCRYGTTFSHSLGRVLPLGSADVNVRFFSIAAFVKSNLTSFRFFSRVWGGVGR
jgi:hypothetical protein